MIKFSKTQSKSSQDFFQKAEQQFLGKAFKIEQIPKSFLPAFFFAGRSNVGKSSLINKLLYRKNLLRTSKIPGCTIQLHFQQLAQKLLIVDSPGYGYAKTMQLSTQWRDLINAYFENNKNLVLVFVLIDGRRGIQVIDLELIDMVSHFNIKSQIIFTKMDKKEAMKNLQDDFAKISSQFSLLSNEFISCSVVKNLGFSELRSTICQESENFVTDKKKDFFYGKN